MDDLKSNLYPTPVIHLAEKCLPLEEQRRTSIRERLTKLTSRQVNLYKAICDDREVTFLFWNNVVVAVVIVSFRIIPRVCRSWERLSFQTFKILSRTNPPALCKKKSTFFKPILPGCFSSYGRHRYLSQLHCTTILCSKFHRKYLCTLGLLISLSEKSN